MTKWGTMKNKVGRRKSQGVVASSVAAAGNSGLSTPRTLRSLKDALQEWPAGEKAGAFTPFCGCRLLLGRVLTSRLLGIKVEQATAASLPGPERRIQGSCPPEMEAEVAMEM